MEYLGGYKRATWSVSGVLHVLSFVGWLLFDGWAPLGRTECGVRDVVTVHTLKQN